MDTQHTPGPWETGLYSEVSDGCVRVYGPGNNVALVAEVIGEDDANTEANARLIASAPDLLAAAKAHLAEGGWQHDAKCPAGPAMGTPAYDPSKCDKQVCSLGAMRAAIRKVEEGR